jgi:hypothetical protein
MKHSIDWQAKYETENASVVRAGTWWSLVHTVLWKKIIIRQAYIHSYTILIIVLFPQRIYCEYGRIKTWAGSR